MVGPPAPAGVSTAGGAGDTLIVVNWTPNTDTDTGGYDVVIDPIPGQEGDGAVGGTGGGATTQMVCPAEGGMPAASVSDASNQGAPVSDASNQGDGAVDESGVADGAATDATMSDASGTDASGATLSADAGCYTKTVGGSGLTSQDSGGACADPLLTTGVVLTDGGTVAPSAPTQAVDDAGNVIETDAATVESTVGGGIWNPPAGHVLNPDPTLGVTSTGESNATYTITGLTNGVPYHVVVASVDNFGNVGPPSSPPACATPAPVDDFWKIYRQDGGQAGGGFCALEAVGAPASTSVAFAGAGALVALGLRRRRRTRRR